MPELLAPLTVRCAELLSEFAQHGELIDRSGGGRLVEVYPGAAMRLWGISGDGYETDVAARASLAADFMERVPWFVLEAEAVTLMSRSDDAFDAVIASFIARSHALSRTLAPPDSSHARAATEGWIALPTASIDQLFE